MGEIPHLYPAERKDTFASEEEGRAVGGWTLR
jgi:hypothetical protein